MTYKIKKEWYFIFILLLGILLRFVCYWIIPGGLNQDEAYSGYEAYSLLKAGMDSHGYVNPVYFISWGHGMNALYAYLTIPFIAIGGLSVYTIRLPQVILGCMIIPLFYFCKRFHKNILNNHPPAKPVVFPMRVKPCSQSCALQRCVTCDTHILISFYL